MIADARPPRCVLVNVLTGESINCLFNPTQLVERVQVNWNRLPILGLSHQLLQYQGTGNRELSSVEFYLDRTFAEAEPGEANIMEFRAFLHALTVPPRDTPQGVIAAPPRTLFIWPNVLTVLSVLTDVEFQYRQFGVDGRVMVYAAQASFEEILDVRVTSESLREA